MGKNKFKMAIDNMIKKYKQFKINKEKLENKREQEEYIRRQERYNDMLRDEAQRQKFLKNMNKIKINTYTKKLVAVIILFCIICISASYILAFFNKDNTLEGLSTQLCITILGTAFVYMVRAYFDSKQEHKNLDNKIKEELEEGLKDKMQNILSEAGLNINIEDLESAEEEEPENPGVDKFEPGVIHYNKKKIKNEETEDSSSSVG